MCIREGSDAGAGWLQHPRSLLGPHHWWAYWLMGQLSWVVIEAGMQQPDLLEQQVLHAAHGSQAPWDPGKTWGHLPGQVVLQVPAQKLSVMLQWLRLAQQQPARLRPAADDAMLLAARVHWQASPAGPAPVLAPVPVQPAAAARRVRQQSVLRCRCCQRAVEWW